MGNLFSYLWLLILGLVYMYVWAKVIADIKRASEYHKPLDVLKHCDVFTQIWIWGHLIILFLWSFSAWEK